MAEESRRNLDYGSVNYRHISQERPIKIRHTEDGKDGNTIKIVFFKTCSWASSHDTIGESALGKANICYGGQKIKAKTIFYVVLIQSYQPSTKHAIYVLPWGIQ